MIYLYKNHFFPLQVVILFFETLILNIVAHALQYSMVFYYQNCSDLLWEKIVIMIKVTFWNSRLRDENLQIFEITRTIYTNSERSELFFVTTCFLIFSWRFLISIKLEKKYNSNWKRLFGFRNMQEKLEKGLYFTTYKTWQKILD